MTYIVGIDSFEFKDNSLKSHGFWWDFKKLKIHWTIPQNPSLYEIRKNPIAFEYHHI